MCYEHFLTSLLQTADIVCLSLNAECISEFVVHATLLLINLHITCNYNLVLLNFFVQILEFDLKGIALDNSSSLTIIVKDFETIGQNKYVVFLFFSFKHNFQYRSPGEKWNR